MNPLRILTRTDWLQFAFIMLMICSLAVVAFVAGALVQYKSHLVEKHLHHARY